jgi:transcriptional regulator with XRE-family HTH domain
MLFNINLNQLVYLLREGLGWTQEELGEKIGVDGSAISKFENEEINLEEENLLKIAKECKISEDYVRGKSSYPFIPSNFYKLYTAGRSTNRLDLFFALPFLCDYFESIAIVPDPATLVEYFHVRVLKSTVYSIAIRDNFNTIFLLRGKKPNSFIKISKYLVEELAPVFKLLDERKTIKFVSYVETVDREELGPYKHLIESIRNWTLTRQDIEALFRNREYTDIKLTDKEEKLILAMREKKIDPDELRKKL